MYLKTPLPLQVLVLFQENKTKTLHQAPNFDVTLLHILIGLHAFMILLTEEAPWSDRRKKQPGTKYSSTYPPGYAVPPCLIPF